MEKSSHCYIWTLAAVLITLLFSAIAIILPVVLTGSGNSGQLATTAGPPPTTTGPSLDDRISENATFPNGSYLISAQSLQPGTPDMAPRELNTSILNQIGIQVDNSSFVAETGRLSYFYIWLPPFNSSGGSQDRDLPYIANIGVRFGSSHTINVVPLSLASEARSGLTLRGQLPDSSSIYELQVRMPDSMCVGASSGTCNVINWQAYSISSDAKTGESGGFSTSLPVACGSQCDSASNSPCATSSCQACDGQQVAGADTPVTRRYNMGNASGTLMFVYETYVVKDRVTVNYEGQLIFDSSCIGTDGERRAPISFDGQSQELRVDVEPNCEGTTGTAWYFILPCLGTCNAGSLRDNGVTLTDETTGKEVTNGDTVYITKDAEMPNLVASSCSDTMQWTLTIQPVSGKDTPFCSDKPYHGTGKQWKILQAMGNWVQGGDATLTWNDSTTPNSGTITFKILGTQTIPNDVITAITQSTMLWYVQYVAMQESSLHQFENDGYPHKSKDNKTRKGYGLFQLTDPVPTCVQLWNWKENLKEGVKRLEVIHRDAENRMEQRRQEARNENGGRDIPIPDHADSNCLFKEGSTRTATDAVAIKRNNGAVHDYCQWHNTVGNQPGYWCFSQINADNIDYVADVCRHAPPSPGLPATPPNYQRCS